MKKLTCEMCESTDFVKQDGVFVCQSCETKYSVEEAKKLMADGVGGETKTAPTAPIDNSAKLDNLYKLARRAKDENNASKAAQYYEKILLETPTDWEAMFYSNYYGAIKKWQEDEKLSAVTSLQNSIGNVIEVVGGTDNLFVAVKEISDRLNDICSFFYENNKASFELFYSQYKGFEYSEHNHNVFVQVLRLTTDVNRGIALVYSRLGVMVEEKVNDNGSLGVVVEDAFYKAKKVAGENPCWYVLHSYTTGNLSKFFNEIPAIHHGEEKFVNALNESCDKVLAEMVKRRNALAEQSFIDYWNAHQTEKAALESEKISLIEQIATLKKEIPLIPKKTDGYSVMIEQQNKIDDLNFEKGTLGIFKSKEKKAIQEQIDSITNEIIIPIQCRISSAIEEVKKSIPPLQNRIADIDNELTKPR